MNKPKWAYHPNNKLRWDRIVLHFEFLTETEIEQGNLWCEYCGKDKLVIYSWYDKPNRCDMATVDHFMPKSKYPDLANDKNNFIVACAICNELKKDDIWEESTIKYGRKLSKNIN